eukprot:SAG11_NODE_2009_length_3927_cov_2.765674_3_plen_152_part_00
MAKLFCAYVFNRHGTCLYYEEWDRRYHAQATHEDDQLLMFGLLFSLREMTRQLSPQPVDSFSSFKTDVQKVHYFQTGTGLRFVLCTAPSVGDMTKHLLHIYKNIFVEYVAKNPLYSYQVVEPRRKGPPTNPVRWFFARVHVAMLHSPVRAC